MKPWLAGLVLVLAACSQPAGTPVANATVPPKAQATEQPLSTVGFSCRLPVYSYGAPIVDSFINFPSGAVANDPNGNQGKYFDRAYSRWLPVTREAVSPDGAGYAYIEIGQEPDIFFIHTVGVVGGKDVAVRESAKASGFGAQPQVFDYGSDGIYITLAFERTWPGVWLFTQPAGPIHKVADVDLPWVSDSAGVIWYGSTNPADPSPLSTGTSAGVLPDEVGRFDIKTGSRAQWLYRPGAGLVVVGLDRSGRPLIRALKAVAHPVAKGDPIDSSATELLIALDDHTQKSIYTGQLANVLTGPIADAHGVWFGSDRGIYLYSEAHGLQKVSDHPGIPANGCF